MADILVTEDIRGEAMDRLRHTGRVDFDPQLWCAPEELERRIRSARALIVRNQTQVGVELLEAAAHLEIIGRAGAGLDNVDVPAASERGVVVVYTPHENAVSVAEMTLGLILATARKIPDADRHVRQGGWARQQFVGMELQGKTLGIVGFGHIGRLVAQRAAALNLLLVAFDPHFKMADLSSSSQLAVPLTSFEQLLASSDIVSCHVPLTSTTAGMFNYDRFCLMKESAVFINTSRGEVVEESGLERALKEQRIAAAALDVRQQEPPQDGRLLGLPNVVLTPHVAAFTVDAQERVVAALVDDVTAVLAGREAKNFRNFPASRKS